MMIDAHQHFWNKDRFNYPWLTPSLTCLYRNFLPEDLAPLIRAAGVQKTVVVQAMSSLDETRWLLELAEQNDFIGGVVGWVDLQADDLAAVLDGFAQSFKLKSVRHQVEDEPNREWMLQDKVLKGLKTVAEHGLCFDALVKHEQLWQLSMVLDACPDLKIVIDHAAKPDIKGNGLDAWTKNLGAAAKLPVSCKLSGLLTEADHKTWKTQDITPYSDFVLEAFGADRVLFGSDWPVSTMASDYARSVDTAKRLCGGLSEADREKVFYQNAKAFYNLK